MRRVEVCSTLVSTCRLYDGAPDTEGGFSSRWVTVVIAVIQPNAQVTTRV